MDVSRCIVRQMFISTTSQLVTIFENVLIFCNDPSRHATRLLRLIRKHGKLSFALCDELWRENENESDIVFTTEDLYVKMASVP